MKKHDMVRAVTDLVQRAIAPTAPYAHVKEQIGIGHIVGIRANIVHDGMAVIDVTRSPEFDLRLRQLEAIARVCMRTLLGLSPGTALDPFLQPVSR